MDRTKESQIWFLDPKSKTIKSVWKKEQSLDIQNGGQSSNLQIWNTNSRWFQLFKYDNGYLVNIKNGKVVDIAYGKDTEGQNVIVYKKTQGLGQQFDIKYLDSLKPALSYGDWHPEFGFYCNKEFSITTNAGSGRYIDIVNGNSLVIKTRRSSKTQKWYFDL